MTIKDDAAALPRLLDSIAAQTRPPDQVVVVDGGSTDGTLDLLRSNSNRLPLTVISLPGANISQGRNAAIRSAAGTVICSTDAGVRLDPHWLEEIVAPLETGQADVVSGFFMPDPCGVFETALAATTLPAVEDIQPERFLPSSRSIAFRKTAWEQTGGYPEWLDYSEDLIFDLDLKRAGCRFVFAPQARVYFRPRENLRAFFKQYYRYARGDGKANLWFKRHSIRYATYLVGLPFTLILTLTAPWAAVPIWIAGALAMFYTPYKRLLPMMSRLSGWDRLCALAWVPLIRVTGDVAKMVGYPVGVWWRAKRKRRREAP